MTPKPFRAYATVEIQLYAKDVFDALKLAEFRLQQLKSCAAQKLCVRECEP